MHAAGCSQDTLGWLMWGVNRCAGCFGAKAAALKAAGVKDAAPAAGKYAAKTGQIPISVTTAAAGPS